MNVPRNYRTELYDILGIELQQLSKRQLLKELDKFIKSQRCDIYECLTIDENIKKRLESCNVVVVENMPQEKRYININTAVMRALTGIYDKNEYECMDDLLTIIYKRFKL